MVNTDEIIINAAFYELFESTFNEDFFDVLSALRSSPKTTQIKSKNANELTEEESEELVNANLSTIKLMKKYTSRIAYIGHKLYKKNYNCSYNDYLQYLSTCDSSDFFDPDVISAIWDKITADQATPKSVKNA